MILVLFCCAAISFAVVLSVILYLILLFGAWVIDKLFGNGDEDW